MMFVLGAVSYLFQEFAFGCKICHRIKKNGFTSLEAIWNDAILQRTEANIVIDDLLE